MENKSSKNRLIVLLIVFIVLTLGLGGYVGYDKLLKSKTNDINNSSNATSLYNYKLSKRTTVQAVREGNIEVLVDTNGNAYLYTIGNLNYEDETQSNAYIQSIEKQFKSYSPKGYTSIDGSTELKAYKLNVTGVLTAYYVHMGNGGFSYFVFVKKNGKLSYLSYDKLIYNGEINLQDINNLENVVSIVENTYSMTPYAINMNGNEISLYDYIK